MLEAPLSNFNHDNPSYSQTFPKRIPWEYRGHLPGNRITESALTNPITRLPLLFETRHCRQVLPHVRQHIILLKSLAFFVHPTKVAPCKNVFPICRQAEPFGCLMIIFGDTLPVVIQRTNTRDAKTLNAFRDAKTLNSLCVVGGQDAAKTGLKRSS